MTPRSNRAIAVALYAAGASLAGCGVTDCPFVPAVETTMIAEALALIVDRRETPKGDAYALCQRSLRRRVAVRAHRHTVRGPGGRFRQIPQLQGPVDAHRQP